jgi:hypothetical protein
VSADGGTVLIVFCPRLHDAFKGALRADHGATEPDCEALHEILVDLNGDLIASATAHALDENVLQVRLKLRVKVSEEGASTREHDVVVQLEAVDEWTSLD